MKKVFAVLIAVVMMLSVCACNMTVKNPEDTVNDFMEALKSGDQEQLVLYAGNYDINVLLSNNMDEAVNEEIYKSLMENLTWEITSVEINEEQTDATVKVSITNTDFSNVLKKYKKEAVDYMMFNLYDDDVTKKVMKKKCQEIFAQQISNAASKGDNLVSKEIEVQLTKNESYSWDMKVTKAMTKAAIGGLKWPAAN